MTKEQLEKFAEEVKKDKKLTLQCNVTEFVNAFGWSKRTWRLQEEADTFLRDNELMTEPYYYDEHCYANIVIKHADSQKKICFNQSENKQLKIVHSAIKNVITITNDSDLVKATTLMKLKGYSQLPVVSNANSKKVNNIIGYISWKTIENANATSDKVSDYICKDKCILHRNTPLIEAIETIIEQGFAIIEDDNHDISGIVTRKDISQHLFLHTKPFLLIEHIENTLKILLDKKCTNEEMYKILNYKNNDEKFTFRDYVSLIDNEDIFAKLELTVDKYEFVEQLKKVGEIRNDIMHFNPDGISDLSILTNTVNFLNKIVND